MNNQEPAFDKKGVLKAMFFAILIALVGLVILGWQYRQLEKQRIPALEKKIEEQEVEIQQKAAQDVLEKFMTARIERDEQAIRYLTEGAIQQKVQKEFTLIDDFIDYEIIQSEKLEENKFRFAVKIYEEGLVGDFVEVIILTKILGKYYVDSVALAG